MSQTPTPATASDSHGLSACMQHIACLTCPALSCPVVLLQALPCLALFCMLPMGPTDLALPSPVLPCHAIRTHHSVITAHMHKQHLLSHKPIMILFVWLIWGSAAQADMFGEPGLRFGCTSQRLEGLNQRGTKAGPRWGGL